MKTRTLTSILAMLALVVLLAPSGAQAAGSEGGGTISGAPSAPARTPDQMALDYFNRGLSLRNKAWKFEAKADAADGAQRIKLELKMMAQFKKAATSYGKAIEKNPNLYQAHTSLGYALRRQGDYAAALVAYDRALELNPNYPEALEYRAEAYLGLDRAEDARESYSTLLVVDPARAEELIVAFGKWVEAKKSDANGIDVQDIEKIGKWVDSRRAVATVTAPAAEAAGRSWR